MELNNFFTTKILMPLSQPTMWCQSHTASFFSHPWYQKVQLSS